jgi:hypothetical protein
VNDDPPLPTFGDNALRDFVGETTPINSLTPSPGPSRAVTPSYATDASAHTRADSGLDSPPPVWSPEQEELLRKIMGGPSGAGPSDANMTDPLAAMMSMFSGPGGPLGEMLGGLGGEGGGGIPPALKNLGLGAPMGAAAVPGLTPMGLAPSRTPGPKSFLVRFLPILHIIATAMLCLWFVVFAEPAAYAVARVEDVVSPQSMWGRWAILANRESESFGVHPMVSLWLATCGPSLTIYLFPALYTRIYYATACVTFAIRLLRPDRFRADRNRGHGYSTSSPPFTIHHHA